MRKTTISRYDRSVSEVTTRPNAAAVAAGNGWQILAKRGKVVTYYLVECQPSDEDIIEIESLDSAYVQQAYTRRINRVLGHAA